VLDRKTKVTKIEVEQFKSLFPMQKIQRIKSSPYKIKVDHSWMSSFGKPMKLIKKNVIKIDEEGKSIIKSQLFRSLSTRSDWEKGSS